MEPSPHPLRRDANAVTDNVKHLLGPINTPLSRSIESFIRFILCVSLQDVRGGVRAGQRSPRVAVRRPRSAVGATCTPSGPMPRLGPRRGGGQARARCPAPRAWRVHACMQGDASHVRALAGLPFPISRPQLQSPAHSLPYKREGARVLLRSFI
jgi:hypothetical protein